MANITNELNNIKNAVYGKEVRGSIHDGIDKINKETEITTERQQQLDGQFNQLIINSGNSNAEVVAARVEVNGTSYETLGKRLDNFDSQLEAIILEVEDIILEVEDKMKTKSDIIMIGDSLVKGDESGGMCIPVWLSQLLNKPVINKGIFGNWVSMVLARLDTDVITLKPKTCIVLAGTNDINDGSRTLNQIIVDAQAIADKLLSNNIRPIFISVPPRGDKPSLNKTIRQYNSRLSAMCEIKQISFVDVYSPLCQADGSPNTNILREDNLHWSTFGAFKSAEIIKNTCFPTLQNYNDKKMLIADTLFDNYMFTATPIADADGQLGKYWTKIKTGNTMTLAIEDNSLDGKQQVITKPTTTTLDRCGISQSVGAFVAGKKYRTSIDLDINITELEDGDTFFRMFLTATLGGVTKGTYGYTYYLTRLGQIKCRFNIEHIQPNADLTKLDVFASGKSAFTLKVGRVWSEEIG